MWRLRLRRLASTRRVEGTPLQKCWQVPLPSTGSDWRRVSFLATDAEMSSLEVNEGELLSIGWVVVEAASIALESARHYLIRARRTVGQSATIHQLRDCELDGASAPEEVLARFLDAAAGRVLVFHNASLDMAFLDRESRRAFGAPLLLPVVDTLLLEEALLRRRDVPVRPGGLRLQACRDRYNLPAYPAHNALLDALATAELLLAQVAHRGRSGDYALRQLL
jgi:DNA polymerase-3 subunit epsilon